MKLSLYSKFLLLTTSALIFLQSCGQEAEMAGTVRSADSLDAGTEKVVVSGFDTSTFNKLSFPIVVDSVFLSKVDTNSRLDHVQIRTMMGMSGSSTKDHARFFEIDEFCKIDSMIRNKTYGEYLKKLDIGMTKYAIAYRIGYLPLFGSAKLFLWGLDYTSYEACPYFSGRIIFGSYFDTDNKLMHFIAGRSSGAGDPPSTMQEETRSELNARGEVMMEVMMTEDDLDVPGTLTTKRAIKLSLYDKGYAYGQSKIDTLSKEQAVSEEH